MNYDQWRALQDAATGMPESKMRALIRCARALQRLGPNATELLAENAEGLEVGCMHGDFSPPRNWPREGRMEARDGVTYVGAELRIARADARAANERVRQLETAQKHFSEAHYALQRVEKSA